MTSQPPMGPDHNDDQAEQAQKGERMLIMTRGNTPEKQEARSCDQHGEPPIQDHQTDSTTLTRSGIEVQIYDWEPGVWPVVGTFTLSLLQLGVAIPRVSLLKAGGYSICWPRRPRLSSKGAARRRLGGGWISDPMIVPVDAEGYRKLMRAIGAELRQGGYIR